MESAGLDAALGESVRGNVKAAARLGLLAAIDYKHWEPRLHYLRKKTITFSCQ